MSLSSEELLDKKINELNSIDKRREKFIRDNDHIVDDEYIPLDSNKFNYLKDI